ncbi:AAA family ATPase [Emticicia agri]|uniref:ATP-binding protein n=1 Tax=Emticicia agri TaxID=2492393 RepID=A0A4Q5M537_9BACT|nr:AAA family ATPase [Emticicia agri]RYU97491.1 ATP-binding protein [Emticicia agri]
MQAIIFCGIQATGKSTFYKKHFFRTHVHISLDLLKNRHREDVFLQACLSTQQAFVVDNTNPTKAEREKYILAARQRKYKVIGYYFKSDVKDALYRNAFREGKENIPEVGIRGTYKKLEVPDLTEGFDKLYIVEIKDDDFLVKAYPDEI